MSHNPDSTLVLNQGMNTYSFPFSNIFFAVTTFLISPIKDSNESSKKIQEEWVGVFCFLPQTPNSLYFDSVLFCLIFNKVVVVLES